MTEAVASQEKQGKRRRGGVAVAFPLKLHAFLDPIEVGGLASVISWQPHGRAFVVHKPKEFVDQVMPEYFKQSKLTSFQRQLNLYGFQRLTKGPDSGGYYHELFLRGKPFLTKRMTRTNVKGTGFKAASSPDQEPDLYQMAPVVVTPNHSSDDDDSSTHSESTTSTSEVPMYPQVQLHQQRPSYSPLPYSPVRPAIPTSFSYEPKSFQPDQQPSEMVIEPVQPSEQDNTVLEEVVDELFLHEPAEENDTILAFVNTWDPYSFMGSSQEGGVFEHPRRYPTRPAARTDTGRVNRLGSA